MKYKIKSPCKINLHLDIHNKRSDGYHNLTSIFQLISLEDTIYAKLNDSNEINIKGSFDCKNEDNLIYKATELFKDFTNLKFGINYKIKKIIPSGGGIGGGSSNCAAVLLLLNSIFNNIIPLKDLKKVALALGSDVPFFLDHGTSLVQGRGEIITPLQTKSNYHILIVNPSVHISTKYAFEKLSLKNLISDYNSTEVNNIIKIYDQGIDNFSKFKNSFEIAMFSDYTFISDIKMIMQNEGAFYSALSGSGSTMFGLFKNISDLKRAKYKLSSNHKYKIYIVKPIEEFPKVQKTIF